MMRLFASMPRLFSKQLPIGASRNSNRTFESLESRSLLAADLSINSFTSDGVNLVVDFNISEELTTEFNIAIYRSFEGISQDQFLVSKRIVGGLGIGNHQVTLPAAFSDFLADHQLIAVLDNDAEIPELDEWNNQVAFLGGVFVDADSIVQVHGTEFADIISVYQQGALHFELNGLSYAFQETEVAGISIRVHAGNDWVLVDSSLAQAVLVYGGADNDVLLGGAGNDMLFGGSGSDSIIGGEGADLLVGEAGDDYLRGDDGDDLLDGGEGCDALSGGAGADTLWAGSGESSYYGYGDSLEAGEGDDLIFGTNGDDNIYGGGGNDTIYGLGGNDQLFGDDGDDFLYGGAGSDTLFGQQGCDWLFGEDGDDYLYGATEDDYLDGGSGHDTYDLRVETGDTIGDRPRFTNVNYQYNGPEQGIYLSGEIVDDEEFANLSVLYSGLAQGRIPIAEAGSFEFFLNVTDLGDGWLYLDFTDAEGLRASQFVMQFT